MRVRRKSAKNKAINVYVGGEGNISDQMDGSKRRDKVGRQLMGKLFGRKENGFANCFRRVLNKNPNRSDILHGPLGSATSIKTIFLVRKKFLKKINYKYTENGKNSSYKI